MGTLADYGLTVTQGMTTPTKPGKQPRPVWNVEGATAGYEATLYDLGGKKWRGAFSFWEDPSEALLAAIEEHGRQSFGERLEAKRERAEERAERYEGYADNAAQRSESLHAQARQMADGIPFGQPVLVGHHSEKRDRNYRGRIHSKFEKSFEEQKKAEHYEQKAAAASRTAAEKSLPFMHRRLKEAEANLRKLTANLEKCEAPGYLENSTVSPERLTQWIAEAKTRQTDYREQVAYWQAQIAAKSAQVVEGGGAIFSKETIAKGDVIVTKRGAWVAERVNALSVSVSELMGVAYRYKHTIPYAEIMQVVKPDDERHAAIVARIQERDAR